MDINLTVDDPFKSIAYIKGDMKLSSQTTNTCNQLITACWGIAGAIMLSSLIKGGIALYKHHYPRPRSPGCSRAN